MIVNHKEFGLIETLTDGTNRDIMKDKIIDINIDTGIALRHKLNSNGQSYVSNGQVALENCQYKLPITVIRK